MSGTSSARTDRFWRRKTLNEMDREEWESLCDGCGKCCLHKIVDDEDGRTYFTNVACRLLDPQSCRCRDYANRRDFVPDCIKLSAKNIPQFSWLPSTCAYRLVADGKDLPYWHPLVTGDPDSVHRARQSAKGRVISESRAGPLSHHMVDWVD